MLGHFRRLLTSASRQSRRRRKTLSSVTAEQLEPRQLLTAVVDLVADLNLNPGGFRESDGVLQNPMTNSDVSGLTFFVAATISHGSELWRTDGTLEGTLRLTDIVPGSQSTSIYELEAVGTELFFVAYVENHGPQLWKTDGTIDGTVAIQDLNPSQRVSWLNDLTEWNGRLAFQGKQDGRRYIFESDGTPTGTLPIVEIPANKTAFLLGGTDTNLFYSQSEYPHQTHELWTTDGTTSGTKMIREWNGGGIRSDLAEVIDNQIYFPINSQDFRNLHGKFHYTLWASDGTTAGTVIVSDITEGNDYSEPENWFVVGNQFFFTRPSRGFLATSTSTGSTERLSDEFVISLARVGPDVYFVTVNGLWKTDGTREGTVRIRETGALAEIRVPDFAEVVAFGESLILAGATPDVGREIWSYNPAIDHLQMLRDINPGIDGSMHGNSAILHTNGNSVAFLADDEVNGEEIWVTDGTMHGTKLLIDLRPGTSGSFPVELTVTEKGELIILENSLDTIGRYGFFWRVSGNTGVAERIFDFRGTSIIVRRDTTYVVDRNREIWLVNDSGLHRLRGPSAGFPLLAHGPLVELDGEIYFSDSRWGLLWKTDGTDSGTVVIGTSDQSPFDSQYSQVHGVYNGFVYFTVHVRWQGSQLWRTDGTEFGTTLLGENVSIDDEGFTSLGQLLYFQSGGSLVVTDGTSGGTQLVAGNLSDRRVMIVYPDKRAAFRGELYFTAQEETTPAEYHHRGLWKTNGASATAQPILEIPEAATIPELSALSNGLVFLIDDATDGVQLWTTDGTSNGTEVISAFPDLPYGTEIRNWSVVGDRVLFTVRNRSTGLRQIWVTDGTERGTFPVRHGLESQLVIDGETKFVEYAGGIAFAAATEEVGFEVFRIGTQVSVPVIDLLKARSTANATEITWPDTPGAVQYDVWMTSLSHPTMPVVRDRVNSPEVVTDAALQDGAYRIWVRSVSILGETSAWSVSTEFVIGDRPVMHSIPLLSTNTTPTFRWTAAAGTTTHELWLTNRDSKTRPIYARNLTSTSLVVTEPLTPARYAVWVRSKQVDGTFTDWSELTEFDVLAKPTEIISGDGDAKTSRPVFAWKPVAGATGSDIRIQVSAGNSIAYHADNIQGTSHQINQDLPAGKYTIFVRALRGNRPLSAWNTGDPLWVKLPPAGLRTTATGVAWDAVPYAGSYTFELRDSKGILVVPRTTQTGTTYHPATPLRPGQYSLRVFTNFSDLSSNWSEAWSFELFHPPVAITSSGAATVDATPIIAWTAASGAMQYEVIVTRPGSAVLVYDRTGIKGTSHRIDVPLANGINQIQVRAIFADGSRSSLSTAQRLLVGPAAVLAYAARTVTWSQVNQATSYELWINDVGTSSQRRIVYQPLFIGTSYTLPSTLPKGRYQTWLRASRAENGQLYRGVWTSVTFDFVPVG